MMQFIDKCLCVACVICTLSLNGCGKEQPPKPPAAPAPSPRAANTTPPPSTLPERPPAAAIPAPTLTPPKPTAVSPSTAPATAPATRPITMATSAPAAPSRPDLVPPANDKVATFMGLEGPKPATWLWQKPQGSMSVAE